MMDAVEILLEGRSHPTAQKLLEFHRTNRDFFLMFASEFFWLKKRKRKGAAKSLLMFLRAGKKWQGVDRFMVNNDIFPLLSRICILLYPALNNRTLKLNRCEADEILGTYVAPRGKKRGGVLHATESLRLEIVQLPPVPTPEVLTKRSKRHRTVTAVEAAWVIPYVEELVAGCPDPQEPLLQSFLNHARMQPEVMALAERKLPKRKGHFSALDCLTYAVQTAKRAGSGTRFTQPNTEASLYCRALIRKNPRINGWVEFKEDSKGSKRPGRTNAVLGCYVAPKPVNGELHPRLHWFRDEVGK